MLQLDEAQEVAVAKAAATSGFMINDDTGYGKTICGIEVGKRTRQGDKWRGLVVCPTKLRAQWVRVLNSQDPGVPVTVNEYIPYDYENMSGWFVAGYTEVTNKRVLADLCRHLWDYVVLDEAHRIKNRKAKQSVSVKLIPRARSLALTATPMEKYPGDLWSLLNFIRPDEFPTFWPFAKRWLQIDRDYYNHWIYGGPLDPQEFGQMLSHYMIRRPLELPFEKEFVDMTVDMTERQQKAIEKLREEKDIVVQIEDQKLLIKNGLALLTRLQQLASEPELLGIHAVSGKFEWLKEFIEGHPGEPMLVFSRFRDVAMGWGGRLDGDIVVGNKGDGMRFASGERDLCFGTIDAMGEGLDDFKRAKYAIFVDAHWSTIKMTQAFGRIWRRGIDENKTIYLLHSTIEDALVYEALDKKWTEQELVYYFLNRTEEE